MTLEEEVSDGATVAHLLRGLAAREPDLARLVFDPETGELTGHVALVLNDRLLDLLDGLDTRLEEGHTLVLLPPFSGG